MAIATVYLHADDGEIPTADVLTIERTGESFISLRVGDLTVTLSGRDADAVSSARLMADALLTAADNLQDKLDEVAA